ncbi:MAG TPA: alpha/beta family hydrolase, partial [Caldimonas sp.]
MGSADPESLTIAVDATSSVSALLIAPPAARACCVLAHGAGAGMTHPFMSAVANGLAERAIATL